ncbi:hypothetical protein F4781DRAFT_434090 [Annulohypoxylon bovei var. microspora]|nr:hypothetical protein F4781DRAFT_434090 [Annulohypoxylon bovei var. microspora]
MRSPFREHKTRTFHTRTDHLATPRVRIPCIVNFYLIFNKAYHRSSRRPQPIPPTLQPSVLAAACLCSARCARLAKPLRRQYGHPYNPKIPGPPSPSTPALQPQPFNPSPSTPSLYPSNPRAQAAACLCSARWRAPRKAPPPPVRSTRTTPYNP